MCCIAACITTPLSEEMLDRIVVHNNDGVGIAWINEKDRVEWFKSKNHNAIKPLLNDVPMPYFVHARLATIGGDNLNLVHPFPIELFPRTGIVGTANAVFAHNGHISEWETFLALADHKVKIRPSKWSDSRAIAHILARQGTSMVLKRLQKYNRFVILSKKGLRMYGDWIKEEDGLFLSSAINGPIKTYKWSDFALGGSHYDPIWDEYKSTKIKYDI